VAAPPPPAPLPPASPTAPAAAEAAAAESGLRSAPVAAGPAGAAGGSTPLAPAPHGVSIAGHPSYSRIYHPLLVESSLFLGIFPLPLSRGDIG
jgi:hypothetical protein